MTFIEHLSDQCYLCDQCHLSQINWHSLNVLLLYKTFSRFCYARVRAKLTLATGGTTFNVCWNLRGWVFGEKYFFSICWAQKFIIIGLKKIEKYIFSKNQSLWFGGSPNGPGLTGYPQIPSYNSKSSNLGPDQCDVDCAIDFV